jgi:hypothetical protein
MHASRGSRPACLPSRALGQRQLRYGFGTRLPPTPPACRRRPLNTSAAFIPGFCVFLVVHRAFGVLASTTLDRYAARELVTGNSSLMSRDRQVCWMPTGSCAVARATRICREMLPPLRHSISQRNHLSHRGEVIRDGQCRFRQPGLTCGYALHRYLGRPSFNRVVWVFVRNSPNKPVGRARRHNFFL